MGGLADLSRSRTPLGTGGSPLARLRAFTLAFVTLVPTLLSPEVAAIPGAGVVGGSEPDMLADYFPVDGASSGPYGNPIDDASSRRHVFPLGPSDNLTIFAVGAQRKGGQYVPAFASGSFHTTTSPEAFVTNGRLGQDGGDQARAILLCKRYLNGEARSCSDVSILMRVGYTFHTSNARTAATLTSRNLVSADADEWALWQPGPKDPTAPPLFGFPASYVGVPHGETETFWSATVAPEAIHGVDFTAFVWTFAEAMVPQHVYAAPDGRPSVTMLDVKLAGLGALAAIREPLWRVAPADAADRTRALVCGMPFPGGAAAAAYIAWDQVQIAIGHWRAQMRGGIVQWMRSCSDVPSPIRLTWADLTRDTLAAAALDDAARLDDPVALARAIVPEVAKRLAFEMPADTADVKPRARNNLNGELACTEAMIEQGGVAMPCLRYLPAGPGLTLRLASVEVRDLGGWIAPVRPTDVFGGPTRFRFEASGALDLSGRAIPLPAGGLVVEIAPDPSRIEHVAARMTRDGTTTVGGTLLAVPPANAAGKLAGLPARPSTVDLVEATGAASTTPFLASFYDAKPAGSAQPLEACVKSAWAHDDAGAVPNLATSPPRFAVDDTPPACLDLVNLLDLDWRVAPIAIVAEIRTGPEFGLDLRLPTTEAVDAFRAVATGADGAATVPLPTALASGDPWAVAGDGATRVSGFVARLVITLPETYTPPELADASLTLAYVLREIVTALAIEIDDLPLTPHASAILDQMAAEQAEGLERMLAILVPAGVLPTPTWDLPPESKLFSMAGLAAHPSVITIGAGDLQHGTDAWSRLGPNPQLLPKPDFVAPSLLGSTAIAVQNALPFVDMLALLGITGVDLVRATLAGLAQPYDGTPINTFYMQGFGVLDVTSFLEDAFPEIPIPGVDALREIADETFRYHPQALGPAGAGGERASVLGPALPQPTEDAAVAAHEGTLYLAGGATLSGATDAIVRFTPGRGDDSVETLRAKLPHPLRAAAAAVSGGDLYVLGGEAVLVGEVIAMQLTDEVVQVDLDRGTAAALEGKLPTARAESAVATRAGVVYLAGGRGHEGLLDEILAYEPWRQQFRVVGHLPTPVRSATAVFDGGELLVFGGYDETGAPVANVTAVKILDGTVSARADLPTPRANHAVVESGGFVYLLGGEPGVVAANATFRYEPAVDTWFATTGHPAAGHAALLAGTTTYQIGGRAPDPTDRVVTWRLDDAWVVDARPHLGSARFGLAAGWDGKDVYTFGAQSLQGNSFHDVRKLNLSTHGLTTPATLPASRSFASAVWTGQEFVILGGLTASRAVVTFDPATSAHHTRTAELPDLRWKAPAAFDGRYVYVLGGQVSDAPTWTDTILRYDTIRDEMRTLETRLPTPRGAGAAFWTGTHVVLTGGQDATGPLDEIVVLEPTSGALSTLELRLPTPRHAHTAFWDGRVAWLLGGAPGAQTATEILRLDLVAREVAHSDTTLPIPSVWSALAWTGREAILLGGTSAEGHILRFEPDVLSRAAAPVVDPARTLQPALHRFLADPTSADGASDLLGLVLPPGTLDPIGPGSLGRITIDTPLLPLTAFTDWGTTNHERATPARLKLLDAEAILHATTYALLANVEQLATLTDVTSELYENLTGILRPRFGGPDEYTLRSTHFYLTDLLTTDFLVALQRELLRQRLQDVNLTTVDPGELLTAPLLRLPQAYTLAPPVHGTTEGGAVIDESWPCIVPPVLAYLHDLASFLDAEMELFQGLSGAGVVSPPFVWAGSAALGTEPIDYAKEKVCSGTNPEVLVEDLERVRLATKGLVQAHRTMGEAGTWSRKYSDPSDRAATYDLLHQTGLATPLREVGANASTEIEDFGALVDAGIDDAISLVVEALLRAAPARHVDTIHPEVWQFTDPAATTVAPLGPYVGITLLTTRNLTLINPLTDRPLLPPRNVTIPLPSLLFENPTLESKIQYRGGEPLPDTGVTLHGIQHDLFRSLTLDVNITIGNITIPIVPVLPTKPPVEWLDRIGEREELLRTLVARGPGGADDPEGMARAIVDRAIDDLLAKLRNGTLPNIRKTVSADIGVLEGLIQGLYSKPTIQGGTTNAEGNVVFPELFPATSVTRYTPYPYTTDHRLATSPPYAPAQIEALAPLDDFDRTLQRAVRDAHVGPDGAIFSGEAPRWRHLDPPLRSPVNATMPLVHSTRHAEIHEDGYGPYHQFDLAIRVGLHVPDLLCLLFDRHDSLFETSLVSPLPCPLDGGLLDPPDNLTAILLVCLQVDPAKAQECQALLREELAARGLGTDAIEDTLLACAKRLGTSPASCEALVLARDLLDRILALLALPDTQHAPRFPFVKSLARTMSENREALGLTESRLVAAATEANPEATQEAIVAAVQELLEDLLSHLQVSTHMVTPPRLTRDTYPVAQALKSVGYDKVSGVDWLTVGVQPTLNLSILAAVLDLLEETAGSVQGPAATYAFAAVAELRALPPEDLLQALHGAEASDLTLPSAGARVPDASSQPEATPTRITHEETRRSLLESGIDLVLDPDHALFGGDSTILAPPEEANRAWCRDLETVSVVQDSHERGDSAFDLLRRILAITEALAWRFDCGRDEIRMTSPNPLPKLGLLTYSVPLAPQEHLFFRTQGEYHFQNADALLLVTPHQAVVDLLTHKLGALSAAIERTATPLERPIILLSELTTLLGSTPYLRIRHLNPQLQVEHFATAADGACVACEMTLARYGGLRTRSAVDAFELTTASLGSANGYGASDLHFVYLVFPIVDDTTLVNVTEWVGDAVSDPQRAAEVLDLAEDLDSKFILSNFAVHWESYLGFRATNERTAELAMPGPWRPNVEDVQLYWSIPRRAYADRANLDLDLIGAAGILTGADLDYLDADYPGHAGAFIAPCTDAFAAGRWYTPNLGGWRGMGDAEEVWGEGPYCRKTGLRGLLHTRAPTEPCLVQPVGYSSPSRPPLGALTYDFNTAWTQHESFPKLDRGIGGTTDYSLLYQILPIKGHVNLCPDYVWLSSPLALLDGLGLPAVIGRQLDILQDLALSTVGFAGAALNEVVGTGALAGLHLKASYLHRPTIGVGFGPTASHWALVDRAQLEALQGPEDWSRSTVVIRDTAPWHPEPAPDRPPARPPAPEGNGCGGAVAIEPLDPPALSTGAAGLTTSSEDGHAGHRLDADGDGIEDALETEAAQALPGTLVPTILAIQDPAQAPLVRAALEALGAEDVRTLERLPYVRASLPAGSILAARLLQGVASLSRDLPVSASLDRSAATILLPEARADFPAATGAGTRIAIIDTGLAACHRSLDDLDDDPTTDDPKVVGWLDLVGGRLAPYDDHGHGTHVAGIAAGTAAGTPYAGIAPGAELVAIKALDRKGRGTEFDIVRAIDWILVHQATLRVDVLSMSLGAYVESDGNSPMERAVDAAVEAGIVTLVAAGNQGPHVLSVNSPASARLATAVGAVDPSGNVTRFSARGPTIDGRLKPEISAPGVAVRAATARTLDGYRDLSGTSMATPMAAGVAALMVQVAGRGALTAPRLRELLMESARERGGPGPDTDYGAGIVDAHRAVAAARGDVPDLWVGRFEAPDRVRPDGEATIRVRIHNDGLVDAAATLVRLHGPHAPLDAVVDVPAGGSTLATFAWRAPNEESYPTLRAVVGALPGETLLVNNERTHVQRVTALLPHTRHPWIELTPRFDAARLVAFQSAALVLGTEGDGDAATLATTAWILDGHVGKGLSVTAKTGVVYEMEGVGHPVYDNKVEATAATTVQIGVSHGGSPDTHRNNGLLEHKTPPADCWKFPGAKLVLRHGVCWQGVLHDETAIGAQGHAESTCLRDVADALFYSLYLAGESVHGSAGSAWGAADYALWPLWTDAPPPAPTQSASEGAGHAAALAILLAYYNAKTLQESTDCVSVNPFLQLGGTSAGLRDAAGTFVLPAITDLAGTLPLPVDVLNLTVQIPSPPHAPRNLTAQTGPGRGAVSLAWDAPEKDGGFRITGYRVLRTPLDANGTPTGEETIAGQTAERRYQDQPLPDDTRFRYRVQAVNVLGPGLASDAFDSRTYNADAIPAPEDLVATRGPARGAISLTWRTTTPENTEPAWEHLVERAEGEGWREVATVPTPGHLHAGLANGETVSYRVRTKNGAGYGAAAFATASTYDGLFPAAPTSLVATPRDAAGEIALAWSHEAGESMPPGLARVYREDPEGERLVLEVPWRTTAVDANVPLGATRSYRVAAVNDLGQGAPSEPAAATAYDLPGAPEALAAATGPGPAKISLAWTPPASDGGRPVQHHVLERANGAGWTEIARTTATSHVDTNLPHGTLQRYRLRAQTVIGTGPALEAEATTLGFPSAPQNLTVEPGPSANSIRVSWEPPASDGGTPILSYRLVAPGQTHDLAATDRSRLLGGFPWGQVTVSLAARNEVGYGAAATATGWPLRPTLPVHSPGLAAAPDGGGYIVGGLSQEGPSRDVVRVGPDGTFTVLAPQLPVGRYNPAAALVGQQLYVLGGAGANGARLDDVVRIDLANGAVTTLTVKLPEPRHAAAAVAWGERIYLFGGRGCVDGLAACDDILRFDTSAGTITRLAAKLPSPRHNASATSDGQAIYVLGGNATVELPEIVRFDPASETATLLAATMPTGRARGVAVWDGYAILYLAGCARTACPVNEVVKHTPGTQTTVVMEKNPSGRQAHAAFVLADGNVMLLWGCGAGCPGPLPNSVTWQPQPRITGSVATAPGPGQREITVTWPPADDDSQTHVEYDVYRDPGNVRQQAATHTLLDTGLDTSTTYTYRVVPFVPGGLSGTAIATTAGTQPGSTLLPAGRPGMPEQLAASPRPAAARLTWTAPTHDGGSPVTGYEIYRRIGSAGEAHVATVAGATEWGEENLTPGAEIVYRVRARNAQGEGAAAQSAVVPYTTAPPGPPTNVQATGGPAAGSITLTWSAPASDGAAPPTRYRVDLLDAGTSVNVTGTSHVETGLPAATTRRYAVTAVNEAGDSPAVATEGTTWGTPSAVRSLTATTGVRRIVLTWQAPAELGGAPAASYQIERGAGPEDLTVWTTTAALGIAEENLANDQTRHYRVTAITGAPGPASAIVSATTARPPGAPQGLAATPGVRQVQLTWETPADDGGLTLGGYEIYRNGQFAGSTAAHVRQWTNANLPDNWTFTYTVKALNGVGLSPASAAATATTFSVPGAPKNADATDTMPGVTVTWTPPDYGGGSPITGYSLYKRPGGTGTPLHVATVGPGQTSASDPQGSLAAATYSVTAHNGVGESAEAPAT